jgi:hypothetical protein
MKENRRSLLFSETFSVLGDAVVGIFLPFLFGRAFGLSMTEVLFWMAGMNLGFTVFVYPLNCLVRNISTKVILQLSFVLQACFLSILALAPESTVWIIVAAGLFISYIVLSWPSWHVAFVHSSKDGIRGNFMGNLYMIFVGIDLVAPLLSGFLLDRGWDEWVIVVSVMMFILVIFSLRKVELPRQKLSKFPGQWEVFRDYVWKTPHRTGLISDGIQSGTLWILWPIFLGAALGSFTEMGIVVALAAIAEMASAKFSGKFTDRQSARKALNIGQWFRGFDIGFRGLLMFFPTLFVASIVTISAGILGPIFNISLYSRTCEIAEKAAPRELEWFISREWVLGIVRCVLLSCAAGAVFFWGEMILGWFLVFAAVVSVGFRKY